MRLPVSLRSFGILAIASVCLQGCGGGGGGSAPHAPASGSGAVSPPPAPVITDINGAATASGPSGANFIVDGSHFGTLSGIGTTAGYSVDFRDATSNSIVATASYAGRSWTDFHIKAMVSSSALTVGTTYKVSVTTPNGTSNGVNFTVTPWLALSPSTIAWATTDALPLAIQGFPTVVMPVTATSGTTTSTTYHLYALGGNTAASGTPGGRDMNTASVYSNTLNDGTNATPAGSLAGAWTTEANSLPAKRGFAAGAGANQFNSQVSGNGTIYVLGGLDATGAATSTVYYASLDSTGAVGSWNTTTALPQALYAFSATVYRGWLYVAGGNDASDTPVATVYSAPINNDGTLGAWAALPSLPVPVAYHQLVRAGGALYVLGGTLSAAVDPVSATQSSTTTNSVYYNAVNPDGTLVGTSWTTNPSNMINAVEKNTVVAIGGSVLASGGLYNGASSGSTEESYATQNSTDSTLGSFQNATGSETIAGTTGGYNFFNQSTALYADPAGNPHVLILGGQTVGGAGAPTVQSGVWYMQ